MLTTLTITMIIAVISLGTIVFALKTSAEFKKSVWILPTTICALILLFSTTLHGEEQMILIILYPVIIVCILYLLAYYLKILYISLERFSIKKRIIILIIVILVLLATTFAAIWINTKSYRDNIKFKEGRNRETYDRSYLISHPLGVYNLSNVEIKQNTKREVEFDSLIIPIPFDINSKNVIRERGFLMIDNMHNQSLEKRSIQDNDPIIIIFDSNVDYSNLPEIKDQYLDNIFKKSIYFNKPPSYSYSEKVNNYNKVPTIQNDGGIRDEDIDSPEIMFKKETELAYSFSVTVKRIVFHKASINGLLYEGLSEEISKQNTIKYAEIYENDKLKFSFIVKDNDPKSSCIDYILASVEK